MCIHAVKMSPTPNKSIVTGDRCECTGTLKDFEKHRGSEFSGVCVLQRRMIRGEQKTAFFHPELRSMCKMKVSPPCKLSHAEQMCNVSIEGDLSQAHHHAKPRQRRDLFIEVGSAVGDLLG